MKKRRALLKTRPLSFIPDEKATEIGEEGTEGDIFTTKTQRHGEIRKTQNLGLFLRLPCGALRLHLRVRRYAHTPIRRHRFLLWLRLRRATPFSVLCGLDYRVRFGPSTILLAAVRAFCSSRKASLASL
jgi:hypothetical protein